MFRAQPLARLRVAAPSMVVCRIPSKDVQVELYRSVQPPEDDQVMPAARNWLSAEAWVTAEAGSAPASSAVRARTTAATRERGRTRRTGVVVSERVMPRNLGAPAVRRHPHDRAVHEPAVSYPGSRSPSICSSA